MGETRVVRGVCVPWDGREEVERPQNPPLNPPLNPTHGRGAVLRERERQGREANARKVFLLLQISDIGTLTRGREGCVILVWPPPHIRKISTSHNKRWPPNKEPSPHNRLNPRSCADTGHRVPAGRRFRERRFRPWGD